MDLSGSAPYFSNAVERPPVGMSKNIASFYIPNSTLLLIGPGSFFLDLKERLNPSCSLLSIQNNKTVICLAIEGMPNGEVA